MKFLSYVITLLLFSLSSYAVPTDSRVPGGIAVIDLGTSSNAPKVTFNKENVLVTRKNEQEPWQAWVGIPLKQPLGKATIAVNGQPQSFTVKSFDYPEQRLTVKNKHVSPNTEQMERISREFKQMNKVYKSHTAQADLKSSGFEGMVWPLHGPQSSAFGLRRFFNDQERNPHSGIDIAAPTGTQITAPAAGKVVLTGHFYFNGKSVFIDHGQGLISMLCHMSEIEVKEGDIVNANDPIGLVGATGRVTGPHLHWTVSLNNARIEPKLLLAPTQAKEPNQQTANKHPSS